MKTRDVQKGVTPGQPGVQPPAAINLDSVSKIRKLRHLESADASLRERSPNQIIRDRFVTLARKSWSIVIGAVALIAIVLAFVVWVKPMLNREKDTTERDRQAAEKRVRKTFRFPALTELEAQALVTKALAARKPSEIEASVRCGPLSQTEAAALLTSLAQADGPIMERVWLGSTDNSSMQTDGIELRFKRPESALFPGEPATTANSFPNEEVFSRMAILTPDEQGVWRMDLPAYAQLCVPAWEKFQADKSIESAVVRVLLGRDNYYNGPFIDEKEWQAYSFSINQSGESFVGYGKRGSAQNRALHLIWRRAQHPVVRVTLEIRRLPDTDFRQFLISRVFAEDWAVGPVPMDETVGGDSPPPR